MILKMERESEGTLYPNEYTSWSQNQQLIMCGGLVGHPLMVFNRYHRDEYRWNGVYIAFSTSAKLHLGEFHIDAIEVIDMLNDPVPCPKGKKFRKSNVEICSRKNRDIYRIVLYEDYCLDAGEKCYCVKHVEPT